MNTSLEATSPHPLVIFATGGKEATNGGSGPKNLVDAIRGSGKWDIVSLGITPDDLKWLFRYQVVQVLSNYPNGGVRNKMEAFDPKVPFRHFVDTRAKPFDYGAVAEEHPDATHALSGFLRKAMVTPENERGIPSCKTINIHPGPTCHPYGGNGMHGMAVHNKIFEDWKEGKISRTAVTMHFVTDQFDDGPIIFQFPIEISEELFGEAVTPDSIAKHVNAMEHRIQPFITAMVAQGLITWSGKKGDPVQFPQGYPFGKEIPLSGDLPSEYLSNDSIESILTQHILKGRGGEGNTNIETAFSGIHDRVIAIIPSDESQATDIATLKAQEIHRQMGRPGRVAWHTLAEYTRLVPAE